MAPAAPLASVIIPCWNGASWLAEAIESCLDQTWRNCEIIVVDNGSTDESLTVARSYKSPSVLVLECARRGASAARNLGLRRARGDFIQFLDADDVLDHDKIRVQVERLISGPASCVASGAWARFRHDRSEANFTTQLVWRDFKPVEFLATAWRGGGMMANFAWLAPRSVIEKAGFWNERLSFNDDGEFFCRVVLASSGILFCDDARGYYRTLPVPSISKRCGRDALVSSFESIELSCKSVLERCMAMRTAEACAAYYQSFAFGAYPDAPDLVEMAERRVAQLGGSDLMFSGGPGAKLVSRWFGWKMARRCQWVKSKFLPHRKASLERRQGWV
jgi:glycosyltransferase involved in cell wall biosynthesis